MLHMNTAARANMALAGRLCEECACAILADCGCGKEFTTLSCGTRKVNSGLELEAEIACDIEG